MFPFNFETDTTEIPTQRNPQPTISPHKDIQFSDFHTVTPQSDVSKIPVSASSTLIPPTPTRTAVIDYTSDLLFLSGEDLVRWDHLTKTVVPLATNILDYSYSLDGRRIAMLRPSRISMNGVRSLNLDLLDMHSKQITNLVREIDSLVELSISPDGQWIAFRSDKDPETIWGITITQPETRLELGKCSSADQTTCGPLQWAPDGYSLLWEDSDGLWLTRPARPQPILVAPRQMIVLDPQGQQAQIKVKLSDFQWSPKGRFGIAQIETQAGICWHAVLDTRQLEWFEVPQTFDTSCPPAVAIGWLEDGSFITVNPKISASQTGSSIAIFKVIPTGKIPIILDREFFISVPSLSRIITSTDGRLIARWPCQIGDNFVNFAITSNGGNELALVMVNLKNEQAEKTEVIEVTPELLIWSPDGQGVLILTDQSNPSFFSWLSEAVIDLTSIVDKSLKEFHWSPPTSRR